MTRDELANNINYMITKHHEALVAKHIISETFRIHDFDSFCKKHGYTVKEADNYFEFTCLAKIRCYHCNGQGVIQVDASKVCKWDRPWEGRCDQLVEIGSKYCKEHSGQSCESCKQPATHGCSHSISFVCGTPLCDNCAHDSFGEGVVSHTTREKAKENKEKWRRENIGVNKSGSNSIGDKRNLDVETSASISVPRQRRIQWLWMVVFLFCFVGTLAGTALMIMRYGIRSAFSDYGFGVWFGLGILCSLISFIVLRKRV